MMSDKSRIIYEPSYVIKDRRLLTTLCILYDEVMLFNDKSMEDELLFLKSLEANVEVFNKIKFIEDTLYLLSSEGALDISRLTIAISKVSSGDFDIYLDQNKAVCNYVIHRMD